MRLSPILWAVSVQKLPKFMESWLSVPGIISCAVGGLSSHHEAFSLNPSLPFSWQHQLQPAACLVLFCEPLAVLIFFAFCLVHRSVPATGTQKVLSIHEQMTGWVDGGGMRRFIDIVTDPPGDHHCALR